MNENICSHESQYFFQYLKQFVHQETLPTLPSCIAPFSLYVFAKKHRLRLIFSSLSKTHSKRIYQLIRQYLILKQELLLITQHFSENHIDHLVLKGIPLNDQLYGQRCMREMRDIDILTHPQHLLIAHHCLLALGYQLLSLIHPKHLMTRTQFLLKYTDELLYWHCDKKIYIDLKWQTSALNADGRAWINYSTTRTVMIDAQSISILNTTQNFFYLCVHAAQHNWEHFQWLVDIASYVKKLTFNQREAVALAMQTRSERILLETQFLLARYFNLIIEVPMFTMWDRIIVKGRLTLIQRQWHKISKPSKYKVILLHLLLYSTMRQKYHIIFQTLLMRIKCLKIAKHQTNPNLYKLIICSFFCKS